MSAFAAQAALSLALGAALSWFLDPRQGRSAARRALSFALLTLLAALTLGWCWALKAVGPFEIATSLSREELAARCALSALLGAAAFVSVSAELALEGVAAGLLFAFLGSQAALWLRIFQAWACLGWFAGPFFSLLTAPILACSCMAAAAALRHPDLRSARGKTALLLLLLWALPARAAVWRLRDAYGLRAPTLAAEAGLAPVVSAERVTLAWLYPASGRSVRFEEKKAVVSGLQASPESLERLDAYLRERDYRSVFGRQAVAALRQGWLFWWEPERALEAALLARPGRLAPDYKLALGLLRGGPMDERRYQRLERLAQLARPRKDGFEDVNTSQLIFEGFASAYARFGDDESARSWLYRVDSLWPIYEKKIEVSPVETSHEGRVDGSLLLDGRPAVAIKVGLFYVPSSTSAASSGLLSQSGYPDAQGRFSFRSLAPGAYYLGLMGLPSQLRGRVLNPSGFIRLTPEAFTARLDPIRVER